MIVIEIRFNDDDVGDDKNAITVHHQRVDVEVVRTSTLYGTLYNYP